MSFDYKYMVLSNDAIHVDNLKDIDDDAQCVPIETAMTLCENLAQRDETIDKQAKELEAAKKRVSELEKAGEDLFHGRISEDSHWAITCGLRLAES